MARYRKIDTRIWNDKKFNSLSDDAKLVFILLLTHPHLTPLGAMRGSVAGLASEIRWSIERFQIAFNEILNFSLIKHDTEVSFIWIANFIKFNLPESPNVVKSWEQYLDYLPECSLKNELIDHIRSFIKTMTSPYKEALPKGFLKPLSNQEHQQEQVQEQEQEQKEILLCVTKNFDNTCNKHDELKVQAQEVLDFLNEKLGKVFRPVENLDLIISRLKSGVSVQECKSVIALKIRQWKGDPKTTTWLRPATLFEKVKFEQYLGELELAGEDDSHDTH